MYKNVGLVKSIFSRNRIFLKKILEEKNQNYLNLIEDTFLMYYKNSNISQLSIAMQSIKKGIVPNDLRSKEFILSHKEEGLRLFPNIEPFFVMHKKDLNDADYSIINLYSLKDSTNIDEYDSTINISPYLRTNFKINDKKILYETIRLLFNNNYESKIGVDDLLSDSIFMIAKNNLGLNEVESNIFTNVINKLLDLPRKEVDISLFDSVDDFSKSVMNISINIRNFFRINKLINLVESKELCIETIKKMQNNLSHGYNDLNITYGIFDGETLYKNSKYEDILNKINEKNLNKFELYVYINNEIKEINLLQRKDHKIFYNNKLQDDFYIENEISNIQKKYAIDNIQKLLSTIDKEKTTNNSLIKY